MRLADRTIAIAKRVTMLTSGSNKLLQPERIWDAPATVSSYQFGVPFLYWYERYLLCVATERLKAAHAGGPSVRLIHVVGCGGGRELPLVSEFFPSARIVASDIAPAMIEACRENLKRWGFRQAVEFRCCPAGALEPDGDLADLVVIFNNVLTYVVPAGERQNTLRAIRALLRPRGVLVGVVHHRWGRVSKSLFFCLHWILCVLHLTSWDPGDRTGWMSGFASRWHYFTRGELRKSLSRADLSVIVMASLRSLARSGLGTAPFLRSDNNLVFVAESREDRLE